VNTRTAIRVLQFLALTLALLGMAASGCGTDGSDGTASVRTFVGTLGIDTTGAPEDPLVAQKGADIVVYGKVTKIDPARWNSPDGKYWEPNDPSGMSVARIYRTY